MEVQNANVELLQKLDIDTTRPIHAISMILHKGRNIEGLRLYDRDMELIVDQLWDDVAIDGIWTKPQVIPDGKQIIGIQVCACFEQWIRGVDFILGPTNIMEDKVKPLEF